MFKLLGGRFWSIAPSSYTSPGSFAHIAPGVGCIPARSSSYATAVEKIAMRRMGQKYGCHTCGTRRPFYKLGSVFVADHIPPNAVVEQWARNQRMVWLRNFLQKMKLAPPLKIQQHFFPQCKSCSDFQGGLLSAGIYANTRKLSLVGGRKNSYFHGFRYRSSYVLPGGIVAALTTTTRDEGDDSEGDNGRKKSPLERMEATVKETIHKVIEWNNT